MNNTDGNLSGDLHLSNGEKIEIKAIASKEDKKATLGANQGVSITKLSETFLKNISSIFEKNDIDTTLEEIFTSTSEDRQHTDTIKSFCKGKDNKQSFKNPQANRCLGNESANINIMSILNTFLSKNNIKPSKELCEKIFNCYINVLLSQYDKGGKTENVFDVLQGFNPFFIKENDNFIYCKNLTQITGAIHLYGYALSNNFNHILICDQSTSEFICVKNVNNFKTIKTVLTKITFDPPEVNKEDSQRKNNVSKIKDFYRRKK
jgi:hypothetical protein